MPKSANTNKYEGIKTVCLQLAVPASERDRVSVHGLHSVAGTGVEWHSVDREACTLCAVWAR